LPSGSVNPRSNGISETDIRKALEQCLFDHALPGKKGMGVMTEAEAEYWDDYYTKNTVMPDLSKPGLFSRNYGTGVQLDLQTTRTLAARAEAVHKTPLRLSAIRCGKKQPRQYKSQRELLMTLGGCSVKKR
jgi:hypothetical protein